MCGIIGYIGNKPAAPVLLEGLKRMEYRGYDSAGLAVIDGDSMQVRKKSGKIHLLQAAVDDDPVSGNLGIGHTRWATHGQPTDVNAHPHADASGDIQLIHNGIIENYVQLKQELEQAGIRFETETDTEVLAKLVGEYAKDVPLEQAVRQALQRVVGTYGVAVVSKREPDKIVAARLGSPLILGLIGEGEYMVSSDVTSIIPHTREVLYLDEGEMVVVTQDGYKITTLDSAPVERPTNHVDWDAEQAEKQGFEHFMLKELHEQPQVVRDALRGRLIAEDGMAHLGGFIEHEDAWRQIERVVMVACGGASYAATVGEVMFEEYAGIPTKVMIGSEFRYRKTPLDSRTAVIIISQSGETADSIAALREAKRQGALTFGVVNVVGSTIAREVDAGAYIHAGPEIAVASTKAMTGMMTVLALLTLAIGRQRGMSVVTGKRIAEELMALPEKLEQLLQPSHPTGQGQSDVIKALAAKYTDYNHAIFLGRKYTYAAALEAALKLKEIAYVDANAYYAGELKHGPLAIVDGSVCTVGVVPQDSVYDKTVSSLQQVKARGGVVVALATEGDTAITNVADDVLYMPKTLEMLTPILAMTPLQLLAYHMACLRGNDVDQPRNLAKSVTVE